MESILLGYKTMLNNLKRECHYENDEAKAQCYVVNRKIKRF